MDAYTTSVTYVDGTPVELHSIPWLPEASAAGLVLLACIVLAAVTKARRRAKAREIDSARAGYTGGAQCIVDTKATALAEAEERAGALEQYCIRNLSSPVNTYLFNYSAYERQEAEANRWLAISAESDARLARQRMERDMREYQHAELEALRNISNSIYDAQIHAENRANWEHFWNGVGSWF